MLSHTSYGNNYSITNTSYNIKYASSPHTTRSLASRPRILQLFYLRSIGYKTQKKDMIESCFVESTARSYILAEDLRNTETGFNTSLTVPSSHLVFALEALDLSQELSHPGGT